MTLAVIEGLGTGERERSQCDFTWVLNIDHKVDAVRLIGEGGGEHNIGESQVEGSSYISVLKEVDEGVDDIGSLSTGQTGAGGRRSGWTGGVGCNSESGGGHSDGAGAWTVA